MSSQSSRKHRKSQKEQSIYKGKDTASKKKKFTWTIDVKTHSTASALCAHEAKNWIVFNYRLETALHKVQGAQPATVVLPKNFSPLQRYAAHLQMNALGWRVYVTETHRASFMKQKTVLTLSFQGVVQKSSMELINEGSKRSKHHSFFVKAGMANKQYAWLLCPDMISEAKQRLTRDLDALWLKLHARLQLAMAQVRETDESARFILPRKMSFAQRWQARQQLEADGWIVENGRDWRGRGRVTISLNHN